MVREMQILIILLLMVQVDGFPVQRQKKNYLWRNSVLLCRLKDPVKAVEKLIDEPKPEEKPAPAPKVDKPAVRKILADLNKAAGTNKAAELIKAVGYGKLSEVPDDLLPGIAEEAKKLLEVM